MEADIITIKKKSIDLISLDQRMRFLQDMFQMIFVALVSVINHYHIVAYLSIETKRWIT